MCEAVPWWAIISRYSSFAGVTTRVMARALE
jgi:hypothetical protein